MLNPLFHTLSVIIRSEMLLCLADILGHYLDEHMFRFCVQTTRDLEIDD